MCIFIKKYYNVRAYYNLYILIRLFIFDRFLICGKTGKNAGVGMLADFEILQVPTAGRWQMTFAPHGSLLVAGSMNIS